MAYEGGFKMINTIAETVANLLCNHNFDVFCFTVIMSILAYQVGKHGLDSFFS